MLFSCHNQGMKTYEEYNPNPKGRRVDDCTVRAISKALGVTWDKAYDLLSDKGREMGDMMHADSVWGAVLREKGFVRHAIPNTCPYCYTAADFCRDYPTGVYVLGFGGHVATVVNGRVFDTWDSSDLVPVFFYRRRAYL